MDSWLKNKIRNVSGSKGVFLFVKAQFSSQAASVVDFLVTLVLAKFFGVFYLYATFFGSVCGGIINCSVNYIWVFKSRECRKLYVGIKYALVWCGSIFLNTSGTYLLTEMFVNTHGLRELIASFVDDFFIIPKIIVSLIVGFFWNYQMYRLFVYRNLNINALWKKNRPQNY